MIKHRAANHAAATLVASNNGIDLHAGVDGNNLYLAMTAPTTNDHFLLVAQNPGPLTNAMWGKAGQVAQWDAFVGNEESNGFVGWFDQDAPVQTALGFVLEATIECLNADQCAAKNWYDCVGESLALACEDAAAVTACDAIVETCGGDASECYALLNGMSADGHAAMSACMTADNCNNFGFWSCVEGLGF